MSTPSILKKIVAKKKRRLAEVKSKVSIKEMRSLALVASDAPSFKDALYKDGLSIIGEIKKASPSKGMIRDDFDHVALAKEYSSSVDALSVLTEEEFFMGSPRYLRDVSQAVCIPILRKDFIVDKYQIYEAKALGASAILLIVAILDEKDLINYISLASELRMHCLVETHSIEEAKMAINVNANIIGINNRDLNTFEVDLNTTNTIAKIIPKDKLIVSESGIHTASDISDIKDAGINGILVGESFMRCNDINKKAKEFKDAYTN